MKFIKVKVLSQPVYGRIMNYHIGIRTQSSNECLIQFTQKDLVAQAGHIMDKKVVWKGKKKNLIGKIASFHGKNGVVRVKFRKGVPGQAIGTIVELVG